MAYTRPNYDAADAGWLAAPYTRPDYDAADATFYVAPPADVEFTIEDSGLPLAPSFHLSPVATIQIEDGGLPLAPSFQFLNGRVFWASDGGLPAAPSMFFARGNILWASDSGLPAAPSMVVYTDPTPFIDPRAPVLYVMDLLDDSGEALARVPISSWQATLQIDSMGYVQCVVPACQPWLDLINSSAEFRISRVSRTYAAYGADDVEGPLVRGPVQTVQESRGATNHSAVISGYVSALPMIDDPDPVFNRELLDVRTISTVGATISVRCGIDWLLRPGQRATYGTINFAVSYINYYVTSFGRSMDAYMDVGYRAPS